MLSSNTSAVSGDTTYIEDVFSTYLYTGNGSTQTITNNIDLSTKGGLVWIKNRTGGSGDHSLYDSARGLTSWLATDTTGAQSTFQAAMNSFNTTGFSLKAGNAGGNDSTMTYASWTFRKQPKFFDVVTYTGNDTAGHLIPHNLGSVPGCVIVKATNSAKDWYVYHRGTDATAPEDYYTVLDTTAARVLNGNLWDTAPTATDLVLGTSGGVNQSGVTYVAYLFAHNAGGFGSSNADNVISCGSFTMDGSGNPASVTLGYEPQMVIVKRTDSTSNWYMEDNMRGLPVTGNGAQLYANTSGAEAAQNIAYPNATGFTWNIGIPSATYIYIAIRRGPMKVPTDATKVFKPVTRTGTGSAATITGVGFPPDLFLPESRSNGTPAFFDRLRGATKSLSSGYTAVEQTEADSVTAFGQDGITVGAGTTGFYNVANFSADSLVYWYFRRAPSFFDEACYTGNVTARTINHNLGVAPELIIVKARNTTTNWAVYSAAAGNGNYLVLNATSAPAAGATYWNSTTPTSSVFSLGTSTVVNASGNEYVAYLFATCPGVSKVGSYTGNGSSQTINCGFAAGARFVMIKRTDSSGNWWVWDTARGIVAGSDPNLTLNALVVEASDDSIDPDSTGFIVNQLAATNVNVNAATYIYLAIA